MPCAPTCTERASSLLSESGWHDFGAGMRHHSSRWLCLLFGWISFPPLLMQSSRRSSGTTASCFAPSRVASWIISPPSLVSPSGLAPPSAFSWAWSRYLPSCTPSVCTGLCHIHTNGPSAAAAPPSGNLCIAIRQGLWGSEGFIFGRPCGGRRHSW